MAKEIYSKQDVMELHKKCCPYHNPKMGTNYLGQPIRCGANHEICNGECWYMDTFEKELKKLKLRLRKQRQEAP